MIPGPLYIVQERESSSWRGVGTGAAIGAVGILLYLLIKNLGGRPGPGGAESGCGTGPAGPVATVSPPAPPPRPKDVQRLTFVMTQPTSDEPSHPMSFRLRDETYLLDEMIARIRAGGRSDVTLKPTGAVRAGSWISALALVKQAGLEVWTEAASGPIRVSGNGRGQYGSYA